MTDTEKETIAQSSYSYWDVCRTTTTTNDLRDVMALREVARYYDAAKQDRALTRGALQRTSAFRTRYRITDVLRSCFDENVENGQDEQLAVKYRALIASELQAQPVFVRAGTAGRGVLVLGSRTCKETVEEAFVICIIYMIERALAVTESLSRGKEQMMDVIVDVSNFKAKCAPRRTTLKAVFSILQEHYPQRLNTLVVLEPPLWVSTLYAIVSKFLDQRTRKKIQLARGAKTTRNKLSDILMFPDTFQAASVIATTIPFQATIDTELFLVPTSKEEATARTITEEEDNVQSNTAATTSLPDLHSIDTSLM